MSEDIHQRINERDIPFDEQGNSLVDIYILMPSSRRYVKFIPKGHGFSEERREKLNKHVLPDLFVLPKELDVIRAMRKPKKEYPKGFQAEVLGDEAEKDLKMLYTDMLAEPSKDPKVVMDRLQKTSDKILHLVAPEAEDIKSIFLNNVKYVQLMNDAAGISSLAVMIAFANAFDSRRSYTELTQAALVMDISLSTLGHRDRELSIVSPEELPEDLKKQIREHPQKSYNLVSEKIQNLSEVTMQLILNHHELFNGKGFPRGIRSESLFPLVRVLSLAVDCFEILKRAELKGSKKDLSDAIYELHDEKVDAHLRRHNKRLTQKVIDFLNSAAKAA